MQRVRRRRHRQFAVKKAPGQSGAEASPDASAVEVQGVDVNKGLESPEVRDRLYRLFRYGQVGRCVSSVTHDVNNMLGAILAYAELLDMDEGLNEKSRQMLGKVADSTQKCSGLIGSLTALARRERPDVGFIEVAQFVDGVLAIKRYDFQVGRVKMETAYDAEIPSLMVDRPSLALATIYLLMNAFEAVQEAADRRAAVRVVHADSAVEIVVWNSGPPVPERDRERIFEPFYTTKVGDHVGLGLTIARETARRHQGDLTYDPARGFVLRLPYDTGLSP